ncbi:oligopeptide ABC transporter, permease protein [Aeropyrum pernix]|uniref:Oligopeptide ABC transporter, permease protein n=1 Tax=Aeropyrum pernix TaxID=56636 RepID=A0A401H857_AERPX|nr:oligopeptide ABC transporter, permease protein [Aeropyrum pernix]
MVGCKKVSLTAESVKGFFREYLRYPIGIVGLILFVILLFMAVSFEIYGDQEAIRNWFTNTQYFEDYPKTVPPCWFEELRGRNPTPTLVLKADDPETSQLLAEKLRASVVRGDDGYVRLVIEMEFDVTGNKPPVDVYSTLFMAYNVTEGLMYVEKIYLERPDGSEFVFVEKKEGPQLPVVGGLPAQLQQPGVRIDSVFPGMPLKKLKGSSVSFSLKSMATSQSLLQRFVIPSLQEQGVDVSQVGFGNIATNLYKAIFSTDPFNSLVTGSFDVLNGTYRLNIIFLAQEAEIDVQPEKLVVKGSCYGLLGTDDQGRDLFQGLLYGTRWALIVGLMTSAITVVFGSLYGIVSGYLGGISDEVMLRFAQIIYSLPALPLLILFAAIIGGNIWVIIFLIVAFSWPGIAFVTRSMAFQIKSEPYVEAAVASGAGTVRIVLLYLAPQVLPYMFASMALSVPGAVIAEASLSFLNLGDPDLVTWGKILFEAQDAGAALNGYWWWVIPPGLAIAVVGMTFVFIGNALDAILNPKLKR